MLQKLPTANFIWTKNDIKNLHIGRHNGTHL